MSSMGNTVQPSTSSNRLEHYDMCRLRAEMCSDWLDQFNSKSNNRDRNDKKKNIVQKNNQAQPEKKLTRQQETKLRYRLSQMQKRRIEINDEIEKEVIKAIVGAPVDSMCESAILAKLDERSRRMLQDRLTASQQDLALGRWRPVDLEAVPILFNREVKLVMEDQLRTVALRHLLVFVEDDRLREMAFDITLTDAQRKTIHALVSSFTDGTNPPLNDHRLNNSLYRQIKEKMDCVLVNRSLGHKATRTRQLFVFKNCEKDVYLITPDKLEEDYENEEAIVISDEEINPTDDKNTEDQDLAGINHEKEQKSDERTLEDKIDEKFKKLGSNPLTKILVKYMQEFYEDDTLVKLKFLGDFADKQRVIISNFMELLKECVNEGNVQKLEEVFNDDSDEFVTLGNILFGGRKTVKIEERKAVVTTYCVVKVDAL